LETVAGRSDVLLTFDDGNASDVDIALPLLMKAKVKAEFFVCAGLLGSPGRAHRDWRTVTESESEQEFVAAHRVLAKLTGAPVTTVAIPYGSYDRHVLRHLR